MSAVPARVPGVVSRLGVLSSAPVGGDQGAVQRHERPGLGQRPPEDLDEVGCVVGDHVDALMEVAVGGRDRDAGVVGQQPQVGGVLEPAQHHHRLDVHRRGPLPRAPIVDLAVLTQPPGHGVEGLDGHVEVAR